jgi:serine/threonine protein kinase
MSDESLDLIIEQYLLRTEAGDAIDEDQWVNDHPGFSAELRSFLQLHRQAHAVFDAPKGTLSGQHLRTQTPGSIWTWNHIANSQFPFPFGPYDLLEEINRGGMGIVYKANHRQLQRIVALKILRAGDMATEEEIKRFHIEAIASSALDHPNIIPTYEASQWNGLVYFTMRLIEGVDLEAKLRSESIEPREAAHILLKLTEAVGYAHQKQVLHRDIKPSNVLIDQQGEPFLADFGLARLQAADDRMTMTGQVLGTPAYMAPEQARMSADRTSHTVDIYALGAVLYAAITGQPPFSGPTPFDVLLQVLDRQPPAPSQINKHIPATLEAICIKAMAKAPVDRYQSAAALANDLRLFLRGEAIVMDKPHWNQRLQMWWRREPILISHLCALFATTLIILISYLTHYSDAASSQFATKVGLLFAWVIGCVALQRLVNLNRHREWVHLVWATFDVTLYTSLITVADPPRGLLLVGYPLMIAASGLFYRVRFVTYTTIVCCLGTFFLAFSVDDAISERLDFLGIYLTALIVLGLCVSAMIRRVRSLSRFYGESD